MFALIHYSSFWVYFSIKFVPCSKVFNRELNGCFSDLPRYIVLTFIKIFDFWMSSLSLKPMPWNEYIQKRKSIWIFQHKGIRIAVSDIFNVVTNFVFHHTGYVMVITIAGMALMKKHWSVKWDRALSVAHIIFNVGRQLQIFSHLASSWIGVVMVRYIKIFTV